MWIITWILAALLNAVMDTVENENFNQSVLKKFNPRWWYKRESWKHARKIFGWKFDAWHVSKSAMIILMAGSIILYHHTWWWQVRILWIDIAKDLAIAGATWILPFNAGYKLLKT